MRTLNSTSASWVHMYGQTDGHGETNTRFSRLCEWAKNCRCVLSSKNTPTSNDMRNWSFSLGSWFSSQTGWHFLKVSVALQFPVSFVCTSSYCQCYCVYVCIYIYISLRVDNERTRWRGISYKESFEIMQNNVTHFWSGVCPRTEPLDVCMYIYIKPYSSFTALMIVIL